MPCLDTVTDTIERDLHGGIRQAAAWSLVIHFDQQVAATTADNIFRLAHVMVHGRVLLLTDDKDLLRIRLRGEGLELVMAIAYGEDDKADLLEIAGAEVRDVPAEFALADLIAFG